MSRTIGECPIGRRAFLVGAVAVGAAACAPALPHASAPLAARPTEFDAWHQEAQGMLSDVLEALRTFDDFQAFRATLAETAELAWDPPTSTTWDEATHVTRGLHGRAEQLFQAVTTTRLDPNAWRQQRDLADATHALLDLGDALATYRDALDGVPPGNASSTLGLLDDAWTRWDTVAARWTMGRAELLGSAT